MSVLLYFYAYDIINQQTVQLNRTLLEKVQVEFDGYFVGAQNNIAALQLDSDVQKAIKVKGEFSLGERELLHDIYANITNRCASTKGLSHIFIYFFQGNSIVSDEGHMDSALYYNLYYKQDGMDEEAFTNWLRQEWMGDIQVIQNIRGEKEIMILQNTFPREDRHSSATLAVSITESEVCQGLEELQWDESVELFMVGKKGAVMGTGSLAQEMEAPETWAAELYDGRTQVEIQGSSYQTIMIPSSKYDFSYVAVVPIKATAQSARKIQIFMLAGLSACILLSIIIAYIQATVNYRPLRRMMDLYGNYDRDDNALDQNEYQWLTKKMTHLLDHHNDMRHHFQANQKMLGGQYLYRLLTLPYDGEGKYAKYFLQEQKLQRPYNLVVLFCIDQESIKKLWKKDSDGELLQFIIVNIMSELGEGRFDVEAVDVQDAVVCMIVNADCKDIGVREELEGMFDQLQKFTVKKLKCMLPVACGSFCNGLEGVYQSYLTAREALEYLEKNTEQTVVWYEDIQNLYCLYDYNLETEQRIINTIKAGEGADACKWVAQVIDENFAQKDILPSVRKCLLFDLLGTVLKGGQKGNNEEIIQEIVNGQRLLQAMSAEEAQEYFSGIIMRLCDDILERERENRSDKQFGAHVKEFVLENYQNPDLNVSITALHFGLTPSYLSSLFRKQTGLNLLEYINNIRVERVKELLEQGKSLNEICSLTGFRSSGALIRVFKKENGITPGQMKKLGNDSEEQKKS